METKWIIEMERKRKRKKYKDALSVVVPPQLSPTQQQSSVKRDKKRK